MDKNIQNQRILEINALPPRSTVLPEGKITSLDGEYNFRYNGGSWDKIDVPSMWQFRGYSHPRYTNTDYPFPFNPPYVGTFNPIGEYKRTFEIKNPAKRTIIHFAGVDNAYYVYINDKEVGFAKGSRNPHEFDITEYIKKGENSLYVKVYTYSDASYLEAQDMLLASGIFRSVYLIETDEVSVWDYTIKTTMTEIEVSVDVDLKQDWSIKVSVDGEISTDKKHSFVINNPILWNAEEPNLYEVVIELYYKDELRERHTKKVGMREIAVIDGVFSINKTPVKMKGVNRHEHTPQNGRAIDFETTKKELELLKDCNVNAIRCSHYPNNPFFYELCNELGFYVVDEADLETHGCGVTGDQGYLSKHPDWLDAYLDRVRRMYERDKNETCVVIWSVGNECGKGQNLIDCAAYLKNSYITKPVLYPQDDMHTPLFTDFRQAGYMPLWSYDQLDFETGKIGNNNQPIICTEFAHSMGNGPGALAEYWQRIFDYKSYCGGFIWEFKSLGFYKDGQILYGGDFGEVNHALNFNLDGLLFSDGSLKPAMIELKNILSPAKASYENGSIKILNRNNFKNLNYLKLKMELLENYNVIDTRSIDSLDVAPGEAIAIEPMKPQELKPGAEYRINLTFTDGDKVISKQQVELPYKGLKKQYPKNNFLYELKEDEISGDDFKICFNNGVISYYEKNGDVIINSPMKMSFYRKPTDNDGIKGKWNGLTGTWDKALLNNMEFFAQACEISENKDEVTFRYSGKILPEGRYVGYFAEICYHIYAGGVVLVNMSGEPYGNMPEILPRIGVYFELDKQMENVEWYGRGEHENYCDRKQSAIFGLYNKKIADMSVYYERPQENANRCDTYFVNVTDNNKKGLTVIGSDRFEFSSHDYSLDNLIIAEHRNELIKSDKNYLYIDYKNRGLGSASCGPNPEFEYELRSHSFRFAFVIKAYDGVDLSEYEFDVKTAKLSQQYIKNIVKTERENFECRED